MRPANQPPVPPLPPAPDSAGHLPLPLLRQYVSGALSAAEQHRIEAHTLDCQQCAEILEGLELSDTATTDRALTELQQRLQQRIAQAEAPQRTFQAWQAVAAVVLLLLASTALWWGLSRPATAPNAGSMPVASQAPAPPTAVSPATVQSAPQADSDALAMNSATAPAEPAIARAAPELRRPVVRQARRGTPPMVAAATPIPEPVAEAAGSTGAGADQAPAGALLSTPVSPSAAPAPEVSVAASKLAPDTAATPAVTMAKSKQILTEDRVARKSALPPVPGISPQPAGGYIGLREYLRREGMFVPEPPARQLAGSVRVKFTVTASGKLENFQILRGMRADYDAEAIRLLCEGPAWQPGTANGRRADQVVEISISF